MKNVIKLLLSMLVCLSGQAYAQKRLNFETVVMNGHGIVCDKAVSVRITILEEDTSGPVIYSEEFVPNPVTSKDGILKVRIGSGTSIEGSFKDLDLSNGVYYILAEIDPDGTGKRYSLSYLSELNVKRNGR